IAHRLSTLSENVVSNFFSQSRINFLVRIQAQNPIARGFVERGILLRGETFPGFDENFCAVRLRDLDGAVGRARIDDDDLALSAGNERLDAFERAAEVSFLVVGDEHDGELHAGEHSIARRAFWQAMAALLVGY